MERPHVVALFGPTGVGKTAVAIALAERLRAEGDDPVAVSADALQVYRGLEILTGAADATEQAQLEHRMISILDVSETFSVAAFAQRAHQEIDALLEQGRTPIVVGGTGLYLRAALAELDLRPPPAPGVRERLMQRLADEGIEALHAELERQDPAAAQRIARTDPHRIVRSLELLAAGERLPPATDAPPADQQLWSTATRRPTLLVALTMQRPALYERINARVQAMVDSGAKQEVEAAERLGASDTARKALGFDELLAGDVAAMAQRTRHYARRQLTWLRKLQGAHTLDITTQSPAQAAETIRQWMDE